MTQKKGKKIPFFAALSANEAEIDLANEYV